MDEENTYIKAFRSKEAFDLLEDSPFAYLVLTLIALRAKRSESKTNKYLEIGEALLGFEDLKGSGKSPGLTRQNYRSAIEKLKLLHFITTRVTNHGTIAKLCGLEVYDINPELSNQPTNHQVTSSQPAGNQQVTTNKEYKNIRKKEKNKIIKTRVEYFEQSDNIGTVAQEISKPPRYEGAPLNISLTPEQHDSFVKTYGIELLNAAYMIYSAWKLKKSETEDVESYNDFLRLKSKGGWAFQSAREVKANQESIEIKEEENKVRRERLNNPQTFKSSFQTIDRRTKNMDGTPVENAYEGRF